MAGESGKSLAITAEALYLSNLMLAPGLAFVLLLGLYWLNRNSSDALTINHLSQTVGVSLTGGALIAIAMGIFLYLGGMKSGYTLMIILFYFTFIHSSLIFMGVFGLVKAMAGEHFVYPLIGRLFRA